MTVIAVGAAKGSPGVTTTVLALAARWPDHREAIIIEGDPSGGDLVARLGALTSDGYGIAEAPSTVQLAAAARAGVEPRALIEHLQRLPGPGEVRALVAPAGGFAAATAIASLGAAGLGSCLHELGSLDVLIDVGRIDASSPALSLAATATLTVLVVRPTIESVRHTRELASALRSTGCSVAVAVIGTQPYSPSDVIAAVGAGAIAVELPEDAVAACALGGNGRSSKMLGRTRLLRAAGDVARVLAPQPPQSAASSAADAPVDVRAIHERLLSR